MTIKPAFDITKTTATEKTLSLEFLPDDPAATPPTITAATVTAKDDAGVDVTSTFIKSGSVSFTGYTVRFQVKAGINGKAYVVRTVATLNNANTDKEVKEGIVRVMDLEV